METVIKDNSGNFVLKGSREPRQELKGTSGSFKRSEVFTVCLYDKDQIRIFLSSRFQGSESYLNCKKTKKLHLW